jgi:hypothetical protein
VRAQPLRDTEGVNRPGLRQKHGELFASEPSRQIVLAQRFRHSCRNLPQGLIPG